MTFYSIPEGGSTYTAADLIYVEQGKVIDKLTGSTEYEGFVNKYAYPLVGQLTPENYQF